MRLQHPLHSSRRCDATETFGNTTHCLKNGFIVQVSISKRITLHNHLFHLADTVALNLSSCRITFFITINHERARERESRPANSPLGSEQENHSKDHFSSINLNIKIMTTSSYFICSFNFFKMYSIFRESRKDKFSTPTHQFSEHMVLNTLPIMLRARP